MAGSRKLTTVTVNKHSGVGLVTWLVGKTLTSRKLSDGNQKIKEGEAILNSPGGRLQRQHFRPQTSTRSKPHGLPRTPEIEESG